MIVKKVKYTDTNKTKVWQIGDLVDYIRYPHNTNPQEKIAHAGSRNFFAAVLPGYTRNPEILMPKLFAI